MGGPPYHPKLDHFSIETEKDTYGDGWGPPMTSEPPLLLQVDQVESRIPFVCSKRVPQISRVSFQIYFRRNQVYIS